MHGTWAEDLPQGMACEEVNLLEAEKEVFLRRVFEMVEGQVEALAYSKT